MIFETKIIGTLRVISNVFFPLNFIRNQGTIIIVHFPSIFVQYLPLIAIFSTYSIRCFLSSKFYNKPTDNNYSAFSIEFYIIFTSNYYTGPADPGGQGVMPPCPPEKNW